MPRTIQSQRRVILTAISLVGLQLKVSTPERVCFQRRTGERRGTASGICVTYSSAKGCRAVAEQFDTSQSNLSEARKGDIGCR